MKNIWKIIEYHVKTDENNNNNKNNIVLFFFCSCPMCHIQRLNSWYYKLLWCYSTSCVSPKLYSAVILEPNSRKENLCGFHCVFRSRIFRYKDRKAIDVVSIVCSAELSSNMQNRFRVSGSRVGTRPLFSAIGRGLRQNPQAASCQCSGDLVRRP